MIVGYYALTEITVETDLELYYGPNKASSVVVLGGQFRLHILPENVSSILVISKDFAGTQINREALYSIKEALDIKFIQPIELDVDKETGLGVFSDNNLKKKVIPYKVKKKNKKNY